MSRARYTAKGRVTDWHSSRLRAVVAALFCITVCSFSTSSFAELRVIIEYDERGHRLLRSVELSKAKAAANELSVESIIKSGQSTHAANSSFGKTASGQLATKSATRSATTSLTDVIVNWLSDDGVLIATDSIVDPRLTHAPLAGNDEAPQVLGLDTGAYMVIGPSESAVLEVRLPANPALGLYAHTYRISLVN